ncbi:head maturation protease [Rhizobium phage RHEph06]|uniref:Putative head protein n=2 Tax=Kleczkowskavirus RHEph4 TaxID=1921526 RepID=L7TMD6_9CAUD|nr:head maturation protease [Rhizobium phage RHEph06]YP_009598458.1 head maturation protease [Rhizobium phage RHEph04]AGC35778.1 putative head protein [Rhizobium phage RHEph05]QXV74895.1 putative major head subunit precursor protein [Rhizobium phage RHEph26]AGC35702.1 putative head protein [Rhizobium phage RHEph04]AGC35859.1 putative head protein [Rhizobium phage RHEph06]
MQRFLDSATVSGFKKTQEGYLVADALTARTGIQAYAGYEVGRPDLQVVQVYRPAEEVFSKDSLQSFSHVPVTDDHPTVAVDAANWKDLAKGEVSTDVLRDGERLRIPLILKDQAIIDKVESGKRELSVGYSCTLDWAGGTTPDGMTYDAVQRDIRANHVAVVKRGRAGSEFRIGDSAANWGAAPIVNDHRELPNMRTIVFDGITIEVTDQAAQAIDKLTKQLSDQAAQMSTSATAHAAALTAKDAEIGELKVKLADAEKKAPTPETLNKMIADRLALVSVAGKVAKDLKVETLTDADIRREVVKAKYGEDMVKDASDDMVAGMFKAVAKDADTQVDPLRQALIRQNDNAPKPAITADHAQGEYEARLKDAWKK